MAKASWTKLPDESWGVKVEGAGAAKLAGKKIMVFSFRKQTEREVELGKIVQNWKNGTSATYMVVSKQKNGPPPMKPRGKITVGPADMRDMIENGHVTVNGVTIVWDVSKAVA